MELRKTLASNDPLKALVRYRGDWERHLDRVEDKKFETAQRQKRWKKAVEYVKWFGGKEDEHALGEAEAILEHVIKILKLEKYA